MSIISIIASCAAALAVGVLLIAACYYSAAELSSAEVQEKKANSHRSGRRAVVACAGPESSAAIHRYEGLADCRVVRQLYGGDRACRDACLGYGTCIEACPISAIVSDPDRKLRVLESCDGCGICAEECPVGAIKMISASADVYIGCSARSAPSMRIGFCASACTACGECIGATSGAGFSISEGIAKIDYRRKGDRGGAVGACPTGCIKPISIVKSDKNAFQGPDNRLEYSDQESGATDADK